MKKFIYPLLAIVLAVSLAGFAAPATPVAAQADWYVDGSVGASGDGTSWGTAFKTIGEAITAAGPNNTIIVGDGTYIQDLTVDTPNLTLKSVTGRDWTTIQGVDGVVIELFGGSSGFILGGATGEGFKVIGHAAASTVLLRTQGEPAGVEISYNTFDTTGETNMAIAVGAQGASNLNISHNTFELYRDSSGQITGIYFDCHPITNLVVNHNTFEGCDSHAAWINCVVDAGIDGAVISNNTVTNAVLNMRMREDSTPRTNPLNNIAITGNTFNGGSEIFIGPGAAGIDNVVSNLSVKENNVNADDRYDIGIGDCPFFEILGPTDTQIDWGTVKVNDNNFNLPSSQWAVKNNIADTNLDAEENWWGDATGPRHNSPNPCATGGRVSDRVDYTPWLNAPDGSPRDHNVENVDRNTEYNCIQTAIDDADTLAGDTIRVRRGTYNEAIDIDMSLTLESVAGKWLTTIDGNGSNVIDVLGFAGTSLVIDGFTITNGNHGIYIDDLDYFASVTIQNCVIHENKGTSDGIHVEGDVDPAASITIKGNIISDNDGDGIDFNGEMKGTATILGNKIGGFCHYDVKLEACECWNGNVANGIYMNLVSGTVTIGGIEQGNLIAANSGPSPSPDDGIHINQVLSGGMVDIVGNGIGAWAFWCNGEYLPVDGRGTGFPGIPGNFGDGIEVVDVDEGGTVNIAGNAISENKHNGINFGDAAIWGTATVIENAIGAWTRYPGDQDPPQPGEPVLFRGNLFHGIYIFGIGPPGNVLIQSNKIAENQGTTPGSGIHVASEINGVLDIINNDIGAWTDEPPHEDVYYLGNAGYGVYINKVQPGPVTISGNRITYNTGCGIAIEHIWKPATVSIDDNLIAFTSGGDGIYLVDVNQHANVGITRNTIQGNLSSGIYLAGGEVSADGIDILCNIIIDNGHGIWVGGDYNNISRNQISNNVGADSGVHLASSAAYNHINLNSITGNTAPGSYGVYNASGSPADATNNWWDDASGPGGSGPGTGDSISDMVLYSPYLTTNPFEVDPATSCPDVGAVTPEEGKLYPVIDKLGASPSMISLWCDHMFGEMWDTWPSHSVGPPCIAPACGDGAGYGFDAYASRLYVVAHDYETSVVSVTVNMKDLLFELIPEDKLDKFVDQLHRVHAWNLYLNDLEAVDMYSGEGCWYYDLCVTQGLDEVLGFFADKLSWSETEFKVILNEIVGQELNLGDFEIEVTVTDEEGNYTIGYIPITIVDFQMPVCEGWNLRSTWLTLDYGLSSWQDIVTMDDGLDADLILRWNAADQQWNQYYQGPSGWGWYYGTTLVDNARVRPLRAYYIHALHNDQFGLVVSRTASAPPSNQLYSGWNLIGADMPWRWASISPELALLSVYEAEEHCTGYLQVLSVDQLNVWDEEYWVCDTYKWAEYQKWFWQGTWLFTRDEMPPEPEPGLDVECFIDCLDAEGCCEPPLEFLYALVMDCFGDPYYCGEDLECLFDCLENHCACLDLPCCVGCYSDCLGGNGNGAPPGKRMTRGGGHWVSMHDPALLTGWNSSPLDLDFWWYWWDKCVQFKY